MAGGIGELSNQNLVKIMEAKTYGTVRADDGVLSKSPLFKGLAMIKAFFNPEAQAANARAKETFVKDLISEFKLDPEGSVAKGLVAMAKGKDKGSPLSIGTAQKIIGAFIDRAERMEARATKREAEGKEFRAREAEQTARGMLKDPNLFTEATGFTSRSELGKALNDLRMDDGIQGTDEMQKIITDWLTAAGVKPTPDLVMAFVKVG